MTTDKEELVNFIDTDDGETVIDLTPSKPEKTESRDDDRLRRAEDELSSLRATLHQSQQRDYGNQRQQMDDPFEDDEKGLNEREKALGIRWEADRVAGKLQRDPNLVSQYEKDAEFIRNKRTEIATNRALRNALPQIMQMNQAQQFRNTYRDVYDNERATKYAQAEYQRSLALGEPDSVDTVDKAFNAARIAFGMRGKNSMKPTDHDRAQMSGVGGGGGRNVVDNTVKMGKSEKAMAMAMYGDALNGDEKKVYQKWASGPGLRAKKQANKHRNT